MGPAWCGLNQIGTTTLLPSLLQSSPLASAPPPPTKHPRAVAPQPAMSPPPPMEELEEEAAPVSQSAPTSLLSWALGRFTRLLAVGPTKPSLPPPPPLLEELEEEILLRFPPHEPALLVRASLVCKRWCRIVSAPRFRRRFRELHRTPPMLGFLCNIAGDPESEDASTAGFVATAAFRSPDTDLGDFNPLDARHGRVLLHISGSSEDVLVVWDPIANDALELPFPDLPQYTYSWTAAVLCAARGPCDHLDCHRGPFLLVSVGSGTTEASICTYSSDAGTWSEPITTELPLDDVSLMPSVLVGNALYFGFLLRKSLLKYDLESHEMSVIGVPNTLYLWRHFLLDGGLALATIHESKLCIWRKAGPEVGAGWTQDRVIELETLLPADAFFNLSNVVGCADGIDVIFLRAGLMLFTIDLKTYEVKMVCKGKNVYCAIPYMSFYTPELGAACTELQMKDQACVPQVLEKLKVPMSELLDQWKIE